MASSSAIFGAKLKDSGFTSCFSPSMRARRCRKHALNKELAAAAWESIPSRSPCSPSITGSVKQAMTMTEKILARASEKTHLEPGENVWVTVDILITQKTHLEPGENVWVNVDVLMTHDVCGPGMFGIFKKEFGQNAKANLDYKGVCHIALAQECHCRPGEVLLGTDSHTCNAGAFRQVATGIGNAYAGFVMGTGKLLLKMEERMTLCNMVIEAGGKNGVVPADETTFKCLEDKTSKNFEPL